MKKFLVFMGCLFVFYLVATPLFMILMAMLTIFMVTLGVVASQVMTELLTWLAGVL